MVQEGGASALPASASERLDSWKEIAGYLKREVRTVQRWEKYEGLPVYRHRHQKRGSVYALKSELDAWRGERSLQPEARPEAPQPDGHGAFAPVDEPAKSFWRRASLAGVVAISLTLLVATGYLAGRHSRREMVWKDVSLAAPLLVVPGDFNGDGKMDLAMARPFSHSISMFFRASEGQFAPEATFTVSGTITGLAAGDFDGDGRADLAVAADNSRIVVLLADEQTAFRQGQQIALPRVSTISAGDLNGNGKVDLVASGDDSGSLFVLWGKGDGSFASPQPANPESVGSAALLPPRPVAWPQQ
jgi:FG-GAP-like repeat